MKALLAVLALCFVASSLQCLTIDAYVVSDFVAVVQSSNETETVLGTILSDPSFIGDRQISASTVNKTSAASFKLVRAITNGNGATCTSTSFGLCEYNYTNLNSMDLTACGCGCFSVVGNGDSNFVVAIDVYSSGNVFTTSAFINVTEAGVLQDIEFCLDLDPTQLSLYRNADEIVLRIELVESGRQDITLSQFCCVPPTIGTHSVSASAPFFVGQCVNWTLTFANPQRVDLNSEEIAFRFPNNGLGSFTPNSLTGCPANSVAIDAGTGDIVGSHTLGVDETLVCTFELCFEAAGSSNFSATVENVALGNFYQTNQDDPRFPSSTTGKNAICMAPMPTNLVIQVPPSTEPPTAEPSTTQPPTSLPPTSLPPTSLPHTTAPDDDDDSSTATGGADDDDDSTATGDADDDDDSSAAGSDDDDDSSAAGSDDDDSNATIISATHDLTYSLIVGGVVLALLAVVAAAMVIRFMRRRNADANTYVAMEQR